MMRREGEANKKEKEKQVLTNLIAEEVGEYANEDVDLDVGPSVAEVRLVVDGRAARVPLDHVATMR